MRRPVIIAMLTDFGLSDGYVASLKGVILSKAPTARIIDVTHTIPAHDIRAAGYVLWNCYKYFPEGTIFMSVVDPGVGTRRKAIAAGGDGYTFLAPDNGLLRFILATIRAPRVTEITNKKYFREHVSRTFHGRDIFAPVAAAIASGIELSSLGVEVEPQTKPHPFRAIEFNAKRLYHGEIIHIDRFGNVITDFLSEGDQPESLILKIGRNVLKKCVRTYEEGSAIRPFLITGSNGLIEVSLKNGNAALHLGVKAGQRLTLQVSCIKEK